MFIVGYVNTKKEKVVFSVVRSKNKITDRTNEMLSYLREQDSTLSNIDRIFVLNNMKELHDLTP